MYIPYIYVCVFSRSVMSEALRSHGLQSLQGYSARSRQESWSSIHSLLQEIFPTQGFLHCRWILYHLNHLVNLHPYIYLTESLCCTPDTNNIVNQLCFNIVFIFLNKKFLKNKSNFNICEQDHGSLRIHTGWQIALPLPLSLSHPVLPRPSRNVASFYPATGTVCIDLSNTCLHFSSEIRINIKT